MNIDSIRIISESKEEKEGYYNKKAAHERQKELEKKKEEYFERGGKITTLPNYDEEK